jgi:phosphate butyryltransferase
MTEFRSIPFEALRVGQEATGRRLCVADDLYVFAHSSGNLNPRHLPHADGDGDGVPEAVAPSMWLAALISSVLGNRMPGPGTLYRRQTLSFHGHAQPGDELVTTVRVLSLGPGRLVRLATRVETAHGVLLVEGEAEVMAPAEETVFDATGVPGLVVERHVQFDRLLAQAEALPPIPTAVISPEKADALAGAILGRDHTLITPILIGDAGRIAAAAAEIGADISGLEIIDLPDHSAAAARGVALVHEGRAQALMKGHLHTDVLLKHVVKREGGLRMGRMLSHVFVMDVPGLDHLLFVTDAAINIAPDLECKVDIVQNAIDLARTLGIEVPKVGVLSAVETVTPKLPSTLDAAVLSKMAERGQITGGLVDGPLAMDNAVNLEAARTKGIKSLVAGRADVLVAPNLEAANMLAKELTFIAHAEAAGVVIGAQVPVILTSRADNEKARLASCAVAALYAARKAAL